MLRMLNSIRVQVERHAENGYPHEVVGILAGNAALNTVQVAHSLVNEMGDTNNRYKVSAMALYRATKNLEQDGWDILGYYHSHPDHSSHYSEYDREHALPNLSYIIISVQQGTSASIQSWRLSPDRSSMIEETIGFLE